MPRATTRSAATGKLSTMKGEGGLSPAAAQAIRAILLGIDPFTSPALPSDS